jgi:hypothetical protein
MESTKENNLFFILILLLIGIALVRLYYKYIVLEHITFFTSVDSIPERFDIKSY